MHLKIGTRGSRLALAQATLVGEYLKKQKEGLTYELVVIRTKGDRILDRPLHQMMDKGLFVKEIEQQLAQGSIDLAVHSYKDVPSQVPEGFVFAPVFMRADPFDVLVSKKGGFFSLPAGSVVGTGSFRRVMQLKALRNDLVYKNVRGNINSRLQKLDDGEYDALVLAGAGLRRLGLESRITQTFDESECVPACGQGALAIELCASRTDLHAWLAGLANPELDRRVAMERAFLTALGGSCSIPIGAYMRKEGGRFHLFTVFGDENRIVRTENADEDPQVALAKAVAQSREAFYG